MESRLRNTPGSGRVGSSNESKRDLYATKVYHVCVGGNKKIARIASTINTRTDTRICAMFFGRSHEPSVHLVCLVQPHCPLAKTTTTLADNGKQ